MTQWLSRAVSVGVRVWLKRKLSRRAQELPSGAPSAHMFLDCSACGAAKSVIMPPMALPDQNGKATELAASLCARCGAVARFDISGGIERPVPEVE